MMLIVTRSAFVAYLIRVNAVTIEDLSFLFFSSSSSSSSFFYRFNSTTRDDSRWQQWNTKKTKDVWKKKTMTTRNKMQHRFPLYYAVSKQTCRKVRSIERRIISVSQFFSSFSLFSSFFLFYSLVRQQFITSRNDKNGWENDSEQDLDDGCHSLSKKERKKLKICEHRT